MKNINLLTGLYPGYAGDDRLRNEALAIGGREFENPPPESPFSMSAQQLTPPRIYKKGGSVKELKKVLSKEMNGALTDEHNPPEISRSTIRDNIRKYMKKECKKSTGGTVKDVALDSFLHPKKTIYEREMGGSYAHPTKKNLRDEEDDLPLRKGGSADMPRSKSKYAIGGVGKMRHGEATAMGKPIKTRVAKDK